MNSIYKRLLVAMVVVVAIIWGHLTSLLTIKTVINWIIPRPSIYHLSTCFKSHPVNCKSGKFCVGRYFQFIQANLSLGNLQWLTTRTVSGFTKGYPCHILLIIYLEIVWSGIILPKVVYCIKSFISLYQFIH